MNTPLKGQYDEEPNKGWRKAVPAASIMLGSLATIWPVIASFPFLPPLGLLMLLGWRLARPNVLAIWAPLPLGFFDDLFSGQPMGSAILLWQLCFIGIDLLDQRLVLRDFWQDWMIAAGSIAFCLIAGRLVATPLGAHVDTVLLVQLMVSIMLFPLATRLAVWLDRRRAVE